MEANRLELHDILEEAMRASGEAPLLYYQAPESVKLAYPCIIYKLSDLTAEYADDAPYLRTIRFDVTYITRSPITKVPDTLSLLPQFAFDRYYTFENLHHYAYNATFSMKEE
jgi:hypothetical protein